MGAYNSFARHVLAPGYDLLRGTHVTSCLRKLEESQWWPLERIEELQSLRLRKLISHAYEHVPYYRRVMVECGVTPSDVRSKADLTLLPVLTRQQVQQAGDEMVADNWPRNQLRAMSTSGSTGTPLRFYSTREDVLDYGYSRSIRAMSWAGLALGDRVAWIGRGHLPGNRCNRVLQSLSSHLQRSLMIPLNSLSDEALPRLVRQLAGAHLAGIRSYPNAIALIANYIRDNGAPVPAVRSIMTGAAEILGHERRVVHEVFGVQPYSDYSSSEVLEIASECSAHQGLHVSAEDMVLEILDEQNRPLPPGREGRIVLTNLHNYGMPFIRYDTEDAGCAVAGDCPCGRTLPRIGSLVGRRDQFFVTQSGNRVFFGTLFLEDLAGLGMRQYQAVQETIGDVVMRLVPPPSATSADRAALVRRVLDMFETRFGPELTLQVLCVDRIEPTPAGKHLFLISKLSGTPPRSCTSAGNAR